MKPSAIERFETRLVAAMNAEHGGRLGSTGIADRVAVWIRRALALGKSDRSLALLMRLVIKAWPTGPHTEPMLQLHRETMRHWAAHALKEPLRSIDACNALRVPVPVIFSCRKYLETAHRLQSAFRARYFGIQPIIVSGDSSAMSERFDGSTLILPVDDGYEGLTRKVFEALTLLASLGAGHGMIKLDDDLHFVSETAPLPEALRTFLAAGDYIGTPVGGHDAIEAAIMQDRAWHVGKCQGAIPVVYGKPRVSPYANGGLYYLSGAALQALSRHFVLFPDIIAGELYEDKAVGNTLHGLGFPLHPASLSPILGVSFEGDGDRLHRHPSSRWRRARAGRYLDRFRGRRIGAIERLHLDDRLRLAALALAPPAPASAAHALASKPEPGRFVCVWDETSLARARTLLGRVMRVAESIGTNLFLYWGTLLGHVREGRILPWDDDIDLALFDPANVERLQFALIHEGLRVHEHPDNINYCIKVFDPHYATISGQGWTFPFVDIFVYGIDGAGGGPWPVPTIPGANILPGRQVWFEGQRCFEPEWPMSLLDDQYRYWRTKEVSTIWDHRTEQVVPVQDERAITIGWNGRKR